MEVIDRILSDFTTLFAPQVPGVSNIMLDRKSEMSSRSTFYLILQQFCYLVEMYIHYTIMCYSVVPEPVGSYQDL